MEQRIGDRVVLTHRLRRRKNSSNLPDPVNIQYWMPATGQGTVTKQVHTLGAYGRSEKCDDWSRGLDWRRTSLRGFTPWRWDDAGSAFHKEDVIIHPPRGVALFRRRPIGGSAYEWTFTGPLIPSAEFSIMAHSLWKHGTYPTRPIACEPLSTEKINTLGATAIALTRPNDPGVAIATSLGELRERLPSLVGLQFMTRPGRKSAGGEYLNYQFGIKPMLADMRNIADAIKEEDKILSQWYRDSGRKIRRRHTFPDEVQTLAIENSSNVQLPQVSANLHQPGHLSKQTKLLRKVWFSGAYMYHAPFQESWQQRALELDRVYGIIPDLETAWNLTAWSWMVDWFANTDDVIGNVNAFAVDRLLLLYGYLMVHEEWTVEHTWSGKVYEGNALVYRTYSQEVTYVSKRRIRANPFSFGFSGSTDLTPYQLGILAALGISAGGRR